MIKEKLILNLIKGKDVLDIGSIGQSGDYSLWELYKTSGYKSLTGIDLPDAEETVSEYFKDNPLNSNDTRIIRGNMETCLFDNTFDVIIAGDVIEHVNNQGLFLSNIYKHLRPNGKLIITTPNAKWLTAITKPNPTHTLWHDKYTLERILDLNGFKIDFFRYYFGNKKNYNIFLKPLIFRQGMIAICSVNK